MSRVNLSEAAKEELGRTMMGTLELTELTQVLYHLGFLNREFWLVFKLRTAPSGSNRNYVEEWVHRIIEIFRLEKTSKIIRFIC